MPLVSGAAVGSPSTCGSPARNTLSRRPAAVSSYSASNACRIPRTRSRSSRTCSVSVRFAASARTRAADFSGSGPTPRLPQAGIRTSVTPFSAFNFERGYAAITSPRVMHSVPCAQRGPGRTKHHSASSQPSRRSFSASSPFYAATQSTSASPNPASSPVAVC